MKLEEYVDAMQDWVMTKGTTGNRHLNRACLTKIADDDDDNVSTIFHQAVCNKF